MLKLYVDPRTRQIFTDPGKGRVLLGQVPLSAIDVGQIEQKIEQKTQAQLDTEPAADSTVSTVQRGVDPE
jgi:hypothetical protein